MNNTDKRGALKGRILWIHLPSISSQEEKTHPESKQMPGLTKLFVASKTSSHQPDLVSTLWSWIWRNSWGSDSDGALQGTEMMLRAPKLFPYLPFINHSPHLQSYPSPSQAEGKMYIRFIISQGDVTFNFPDLWEWQSRRTDFTTA